MTDERDETIERLRAVLREPPTVDPGARARVLVAVAAERERGVHAWRGARWPARWAAAVTGLVAAVLLVAWLAWPRTSVVHAPATSTAVSPGVTTASDYTMLAGDGTDAGALRRVQLLFRDPTAHTVSVVGDFTEWDAHQAPMTRDSASGLWSVTLALHPGRHVYAFLVDDTVWVQDPRALEAPDADFGRPGSVLLVGQP